MNRENGRSDDATASSGVNFIEFDDKSGAKIVGSLKDEDLIRTEEGSDGIGSKFGELEQLRNGGPIAARRERQLMKRSNILAKQVISLQSALSLGFISQLWVDTVSVGNVVFIQDESVMENELKMVGPETLVGYDVVTPGGQTIGKVSTYALLVEDALEVVSDTVVGYEAAASHIQRLTKGVWDT